MRRRPGLQLFYGGLLVGALLAGCGQQAAQLNNEAVDLLTQERVGEAVRLLHEALRLDPAQMTTHINLAEALARQGDYDTALQHAAKVLSQEPDNVRVRTQIAEIYLSKGDKQAAAGHVEKLRSAQPTNAYYLYLAGLCAEDATKSESLYLQALELEKRIEPYLALAGAQSEKGAPDQALATLDTAATLNAKSVDLPLLRSAFLAQKGRVDEATQVLLAAQTQFPDDARVALRLGDIFMDTGQFTEAQAQYRKASQSSRFGTQAKLCRAICLYREGGRDAQARDLCEELRKELGEDHALLLNLRGVIALRRGQAMEAKQLFQKSIKLQPNQPVITDLVGKL